MNTYTQLYVRIPTLMVADLLHMVIYPHNASSYGGRLPFSLNDPLDAPMLEVKDVEKSEGRDLILNLQSILLNFRPLFLLSLYNWVCDPIWATSELPEAASWPAKIGKYTVDIIESRLLLLNSTSLPEPSESHAGFPAGATFHSILTNRNRHCVSLVLNARLACTIGAHTRSMNCSGDFSITNTLHGRIREVYQKPSSPSNVQLSLDYGYHPISSDSSSFDTHFKVVVNESLLLVPVEGITEIVDILSFQGSHLYSSLLASSSQEIIHNGDILVDSLYCLSLG